MARRLAQRVLVSCLSKPPLRLQKPLHLERYSFLGIFDCQKRLSHKDVEILDHTCEITNYNDYRMNYKPIIHVVVQTLKEILDMSTHETNKILASHPQLKKRSRVNILNNYYNLLEAGVRQSSIIKNVWLLAHDDTKLKEKLDCISTLNMSNEDLIPWLHFTQDELANNISYIQSDPVPYTYNKIEYLAHRLECSVEELCKMTVRCSFILKIPVPYIDKKLNVLHEYNVSNESILKDLWVLRYSENHIRHRFELYKDTGNIELKTWAIRCPLRVVIRSIQKNNERRDFIENYNNVKEYLLYKLNVEQEDLNICIAKWPSILRINPTKLDNLITILFKNGITSNEILNMAGLIFHFSLQTIEKRIKMLNERNMPVKITTLKLSVATFKQCIERNEISKRRNQLMQNYPNNKIYLMYKLNIDKGVIENFLEKWPLVIKVDVLKLEEMFDMLYQNGFTKNDILGHGRIAYFSVETIRNRLEILKTACITPKITTLLYTKKQFDYFMRTRKVIK